MFKCVISAPPPSPNGTVIVFKQVSRTLLLDGQHVNQAEQKYNNISTYQQP